VWLSGSEKYAAALQRAQMSRELLSMINWRQRTRKHIITAALLLLSDSVAVRRRGRLFSRTINSPLNDGGRNVLTLAHNVWPLSIYVYTPAGLAQTKTILLYISKGF